ncbi:MAG: hypothetical protein KAG66_17660, partial [Methylococcales bacterium]|nr:hypothetical protein [Methylococcales bacterium]
MSKSKLHANMNLGILRYLLISTILVALSACDSSSSGDSNNDPNNVAGDGGGSGTDTTGAPGISFSAATYTVSEGTPKITIAVERSGDSAEAISVNYAAANGTGIDGEDFTATSGTLNWDINDSAAKTFDVQITADDATEGEETVELALSSPSSNTSLGKNETATLTITDYVVGECNGEISEGAITADTVLSEPCYKVPNGISVENPANLTISPGVKLVFEAGTNLEVNGGASLTAVGTAEQPIIFSAADPTPGFWKGIRFDRSNSTNNKLDYVTVEYGVNNIGAMSRRSSYPARISIKNTISRYASSLGVNIHGSSVIVDAF